MVGHSGLGFIFASPAVGLVQHVLFVLFVDDQQFIGKILVELHKLILSQFPLFLFGQPVGFLEGVGFLSGYDGFFTAVELLFSSWLRILVGVVVVVTSAGFSVFVFH